MDIRLNGRSAVITGGSKGLGLAMAERFAASGADVAIVARSPETLAEAKKLIQKGAKGKVAAISADVSKAADIRRAYDQIMSEFGKIDRMIEQLGDIGPLEIARTGSVAISCGENVLSVPCPFPAAPLSKQG